jgi:glycosyltransferase involved in cell wall biosynthesis
MKVLLLNQCFWPDVVATAQQLTDLAAGLVERGHYVTVVCSDRGYDDQQLRFPRRERWNGVEIIRVRSMRANKNSRFRRAVNFASFSIACAFRLGVLPRQDAVVALTSPPLISWLASWFTRIKGGRMIFWVMDLNPDEAIAAGWLTQESLTAKVLGALLQSSLRRAQKIVALDRFVKQRIVAKGIREEKIDVIAPWAHDDSARFDEEGREAFRRAHNLAGKFVVMYAGNHSPCHPLDTVLRAAQELRTRADIVFVFAGGGSEQNKVREFAHSNQLENVVCLPYQPLEKLSALLSAADLHVVVMGERFAGIVHPSKIYNILAIGSSFLYIGPMQSHMGDIIARLGDPDSAFHAGHGDTNVVAQLIVDCAEKYRARRAVNPLATASGSVTPTPLAQEFSKAVLLPRLVAHVEALCVHATEETIEPSATKLESAV